MNIALPLTFKKYYNPSTLATAFQTSKPAHKPVDKHILVNKPVGQSVLVFDRTNLDSLLAAAILIDIQVVKPNQFVAYDRSKGISQFSDHKNFTVVGVELNQKDMLELFQKSDDIRVFAHSNTYNWANSNQNENLKIAYTHEFLHRTEYGSAYNSVAALVMHFFHDQAARWGTLAEDVANYINFRPLPSNSEGNYLPMAESILYDLQRKLTRIFSFSYDVKSDIADMRITAELEDYTSSYKAIREDILRNRRKVIYGKGQAKLVLTTMNVHECQYHEYAKNVLMSEDAFMGYFDTPTCRVWRLSSKNSDYNSIVLTQFKPLSTWFEAGVLCIATELPQIIS